MGTFSISDIENLTGIKAHTIRVWEIRYQLVEAKRTDTNIRYYDDDDLRIFLNISGLLHNGYKISKIAKMQQAEIADIVSGLRGEHHNHAIKVQQLVGATLQLDNYSLNKLLETSIDDLGLLNAVTQIFFSFLYKIGEMWQLGTLNPAHEHFATNLIRHKIIAATDSLPDDLKIDAKRFMLFLPQDETHDVGLLLAQYLLKQHGHHTLYLGQNMPFSDLFNTADYYKPDFAVTAIALAHNKEADKLLARLLDSLPNWPLVISGSFVKTGDMPQHDRLLIIKDFASFIKLIS